MNQAEMRDTLKTTLDVWRFQVDSYWARNSYFATFHTAIMAAVWEVSKTASGFRRLAAEFFCYAGMFLAIVWFVNNIRVHQYIIYWWKRAAAIEKLLAGPEQTHLVLGYDQHRGPKVIPGDYHIWMNSVPLLFLVIWIVICFVCFPRNA